MANFNNFLVISIFFAINVCHSQYIWTYNYVPSPPIYTRPVTSLEYMVDNTNDFCYKFLNYHSRSNRNNFAFSPTALSSVMIAVYEGSVDTCSNEIRETMSLPMNLDITRIGFRDIQRRLRVYFFNKENPLSCLSLNKENVTITPEYENVLEFYGYDLGPQMIGSRIDIPETTIKVETTTVLATTEAATKPEETTTPEATTMKTTEIPTTTVEATTTPTTAAPTTTDMPVTTTEAAPTEPPTTEAITTPTTEKQTTTTEATTTPVTTPTTEPVTTPAATTEPVTTPAPTTEPATTPAPTTEPATTPASTTEPTTTPAPTTEPATTPAVTTEPVTTAAPTTEPVTTPAPTTEPATTSAAVTDPPTTPNPTTEAPTTPPTTEAETTPTEATTPPTTEAATTEETTTAETTPATTEETTTADAATTESAPDSSLIRIAKLRTSKKKLVALEKAEKANRIKRQIFEDFFGQPSYPYTFVDRNPVIRLQIPRTQTQQVYFRPRSLPVQNEIQHLFYLNPQETIQTKYKVFNAPMKHAYLSSLRATALDLDLDSKNYNMMLMIPDNPFQVENLVKSLNAAPSLRKVRSTMTTKMVQAIVPDFKMNGRVVLTNALQDMGIGKIFEPNKECLRPMTNEKNIYVKHIEQVINLSIKTKPVNQLRRNLGPYAQPVELSVNHPFLFFIMDKELDLAILAGRVMNPMNVRITK